ncbi:hypothetical protein VX037_18740 [Gordonia sp. Z-3]|uniref:hypothetical protein n=1 Tax=Gordonia sp. Z-3 TaxID=3115408 RepID=UPI002E2DF0A9|nr:hypothetical protein [Gordonia sp. Z-3]MED5803065.1 hypothetical protein [Gordonia sp. Z-3]
MLLTDWFFAVNARLQPRETSALLESLAVVRNPSASDDIQHVAVEHITECEQLQRAYALPELIMLLFSEEAEIGTDLESSIRRMIGKTVGDSSLARKLTGLVSASATEMAAQLRREVGIGRNKSTATPYLELGDLAPEVLTLAVIREAARRGSEAVEGITRGDKTLPVFDAARSGSLGRLPFSLAIETLALCDEPFDSWRPEVASQCAGHWTAWLGQPDLVELVVRLIPHADGVRDRLRDAITFESLAPLVGLNPGTRPRPDVAWLGCRDQDALTVAVILWQASQWSASTYEDPGEVLRQLNRVWGAPEAMPRDAELPISERCHPVSGVPSFTETLIRLAGLRFPRSKIDVSVVVGDPEHADDSVLRSLHSPWLDRNSEREDQRDPADNYPDSDSPNYHHVDDHVAILRMLASVEPLDVLLRYAVTADEGDVPDYLWQQLLNLAGAFGNPRLHYPLKAIKRGDSNYATKSPYDQVVLSLAEYATRVIDRLGKGEAAQQIPPALVNFLIENAGPRGRANRNALGRPWNRQEERLFAQAAPLLAARWAKECFSGYVRNAPDSSSSWFDGGEQSAAAVLVRLCLGDLWDYLDHYLESGAGSPVDDVMMEAALLASEAFPAILNEYGRTWQWRATYEALGAASQSASHRTRNTTRIGYGAPLLAGRISLSEWKALGELDLERLKGGADLSVLTIRTRELLENRGVSVGDEWVEEWKRSISRVNSPSTLARATRAALTDILDAPPQPAADEVLRLQEIVVDAVMEFSNNTIHYQAEILERLDRRYQMGQASKENLEVRWFETAVRQLQRTRGGSDAGPWARLGWVGTAAVREELIERLVWTMLSKTVQATPLVRDLNGVWQDSLHTSLPIVTGHDASDEMLCGQFGDPRNALSYQRNGDTLRVGWRGRLPDHDMADRFLQTTDTDCGPFAGVVASIETGEGPDRFLVNAGLADALDSPRIDGVEVGDLVALSPGNGVTASRPVVGPLNEHEMASVRIDDGNLTVIVNGIEQLLTLDDPQISFYWHPDILAPSEGASLTTEVIRHPATGTWIPQPRPFAQLIANEFGDDVVRAVSATVVDISYTIKQPRVFISTRPGATYEIQRRSWSQGSWDLLQDALDKLLDENISPNGLRITIGLSDAGISPSVQLVRPSRGDEIGAIDQRNILWRSIFGSGQLVDIIRDGETWYASPQIHGMPERITVDLGETVIRSGKTHGRARLTPGGWNLWHQRRSRAAMQLVKTQSLKANARDPEALHEIVSISVGQTLRLFELAGDVVRGEVMGATTRGLEVGVAPESLTFGSGTPQRSKYANRKAIVTGVEIIRERSNSATPTNLEVPDGVDEPLTGCVYSYGLGDNRCDIWVEVNAEPILLSVPLSAFDYLPSRAGDLVSARRKGDGWLISASQRKIHLRALWDARRSKSEPVGLALGDIDIPGLGLASAVEDPIHPIVHCSEPSKAVRSLLFGIRIGDGMVTELAQGFAGTPGYSRVCANCNGDELYGEAKQGAFGRRNQGWSGSYLTATEIPTESTTGVSVDLHRVFQAGRTVSTTKRPTTSAAAKSPRMSPTADAPTRWAAYQEWLRCGTSVVTGRFDTERGRPNVLELTDLILPDFPQSQLSSAEPITSIQFERNGDRAWLDENYDREMIRARVNWSESRGWTASCREAQPLTVELFEQHLREIGFATRRDKLSFSLRFAGKVGQKEYLFEWGFGWTVLVPSDRLVGQKPTTRGNWKPFFGDEINKFKFETREVGGENRLCIIVNNADVRWSVEKTVWDEARKGILQQVTVIVYPRSGRVIVTGTKVRKRDVDRTGQQRHERFRNAQFDSTSQSHINAMLTSDERASDRPAQFDVYARVDKKLHPNSNGGVKLNVITSAGTKKTPTLQPYEYVFMIAGPVEEKVGSGTSNDYVVTFQPAQRVRGWGPGWLLARVFRRQFSFRESTLRVAHRENPDAFVGTPMLVQLIQETDVEGVWTGKLTSAPFRQDRYVRRWLSTIEEAHVTVGSSNKEKNQVSIEIMPGVLFSLTLRKDARIPRYSSISTLRMRGNEYELEQVVESNQAFVPDSGRPAIVFPKDDTLRNAGNNGHDGMTIAGLPSITVSDEALARYFSYRKHPRFAILAFERKSRRLTLSTNPRVNAGALRVQERSRSPIVWTAPNSARYSRGTRFEWSQMTFLDGATDDVIQHLRRGEWRYHDRTTGYWRRDRKNLVVETLSEKVTADEGPLFFTTDWRLRYKAEELTQFGFPATEIMENGLPGAQDRSACYPVAGSTRTALWIELSPGRVVKIPTNLLYSSESGRPNLRSMLTEVFAAGDIVELRRQRDFDGSIPFFALMSWNPGPRAYFQDAYVLVPLRKKCKGGGLELGETPWRLTYPTVYKRDDLSVPGHGWLTPDNSLEPLGMHTVTVGDVAFLLYDEEAGRFAIDGLPDVEVYLDQNWNAADMWLRILLESQDTRSSTLMALGGSCPVRISQVSNGAKSCQLRVVSTGFSIQKPPTGALVSAQVLGLVDSHRALARSGGMLFLSDIDDLVANLPVTGRAAAVAELNRTATALWLEWDGEKWRSSDMTARDSVEADVVTNAGSEPGILVRERKSSALLWVDLDQCGLTFGAKSGSIASALRMLGRPLVLSRTDPDGRFSAVNGVGLAHVRQQIESSDTVSVCPLVQVLSDSVHYTYIASVHPSNLLVELRTEEKLDNNDPIRAEVISNRPNSVIAVPAGTARSEIDLPAWIIPALRQSRVKLGLRHSNFRVLAEKRVAGYTRGARDGLEINSNSSDVDADITAAYASFRRGEATEENREHIIRAVSRWLDERCRPLLVGDITATKDDIDGVPMLSAVLLTSELAQSGVISSAMLAQISVHNTYVCGLLAAGSMHTEVLLKSWLLAPDIETREGQWLRLNNLILWGRRAGGRNADEERHNGTLNSRQREEVSTLCEGILARRHRIDDPALIEATLALQYCVMQSESLDLVWPVFGTTICAQLAALGRGMTPGHDIAVSQPHLYPGQIRELKVLLDRMLQAGIPITLSARNMPMLPDRTRKWAIDALGAVLEDLHGCA